MNSVSPQRVYNLVEELRHKYKREVKTKGSGTPEGQEKSQPGRRVYKISWTDIMQICITLLDLAPRRLCLFLLPLVVYGR